ncbi:MAG: sensor histidine kinase, partial [Asticcacaulis sp.]
EVMTMISDKLPEEKKKSLIASALTEAFRLDYCITNILYMAKFEAHAVRPRFEVTRLSQLINDSLTRLGPLKTRGDIDIRPLTSQDELRTDPMLGARAIGLVIHNAFKHGVARGSSDQARVEVEYGVRPHEAFVRIRDHGDGIPDDKQTAIFDKYTRLTRSDQQNAGTGLGLTICQHIMHILMGRIDVANHPDGGAIFTLHFTDQARG